MAFARKTMVSDLPLPWVCQTTPPDRLPSEIPLVDPAHDLLYAEVLLVAGDFLFAGIEEG
jgi:hypothetical protein